MSAVGSASARVEAALGGAERLNPRLNAYLHIDPEGARAAATEEDARDTGLGGAPDPTRPLAGMPICVKDIVDVAGMPTTAGGAEWVRHPDRDATVVARLRAAGVAVEEFSLHLPSLDEVFFTLTGTRSRDDNQEALV